MPIVSKDYIKYGRLITLRYMFSDGTVRTLRVRGADAQVLLTRHEAHVRDSKAAADIDEAVSNDSDTPTEDTTQAEMYKAWMFKGYRSTDPIEAYKYLSKVAVKVLALGLTPQQLATTFNEPLETVNDVIDRWNYLKANKETILAYKAVKDGM